MRVLESDHSHVDGTVQTRDEVAKGGPEAGRHIRELVEAACVFLVVFVVLHFSIQNFRIDGMSMWPTFVNEQHIIVSKLPYLQVNLKALESLLPFRNSVEDSPSLIASTGPSYGDVIAFDYPRDPSRGFVKRVIGLPGDSIEVKRGQVIRNGRPLAEPYVVNNDRGSIGPGAVPYGHYYVLGSN